MVKVWIWGFLLSKGYNVIKYSHMIFKNMDHTQEAINVFHNQSMKKHKKF
jgi:hypothetical protein